MQSSLLQRYYGLIRNENNCINSALPLEVIASALIFMIIFFFPCVISVFSSAVDDNPRWSPKSLKKESDSSSCEDTGQAYVLGEDNETRLAVSFWSPLAHGSSPSKNVSFCFWTFSNFLTF